MQVNITKRIDTPEGKRYCPVIIGPNGRIKPDWVRWMTGRRSTRKAPTTSTGMKTENADACPSAMTRLPHTTVAFENKESWMRLRQVSLFPNPIEDNSRLRIRSAVDDFLEEILLTRQRKTWRGYCVSLRYFLESCENAFLRRLSGEISCVSLRSCAIQKALPTYGAQQVRRGADFPPPKACRSWSAKTTARVSSIRKSRSMKTTNVELHGICSLYHSTLYDFYLMSGFREQEAMHLLWKTFASTQTSSRCAGNLNSAGRRKPTKSVRSQSQMSC